MKHVNLIYLDTGFITEAYESEKEIKVPSKITKKTVYSGEISGLMLKGAASTEEEKDFSISPRQMYGELKPYLTKFPTFDLEKVNWHNLPELFWAEGNFCGGRSSLERGNEAIASATGFQLQSSSEPVKIIMKLVTNDVYFTSGYDQVSRYGYALLCAFGLRAQLLVRLLCIDKYYLLGAPMVIIKKGNSILDVAGQPAVTPA